MQLRSAGYRTWASPRSRLLGPSHRQARSLLQLDVDGGADGPGVLVEHRDLDRERLDHALEGITNRGLLDREQRRAPLILGAVLLLHLREPRELEEVALDVAPVLE